MKNTTAPVREAICDAAHDAFAWACDVETSTDEGFRYFLLIITVFMFGGGAYTAAFIDHSYGWAAVFTVFMVLGLVWDAGIWLVHLGIVDLDD